MRARQAAERLFGLRLEPEAQVQLANHLQQLGLNDLAESVLNRARGQSGNRVSTLVLLMEQYMAQNKPQLAAEVAYQVLFCTVPKAPISQPTVKLFSRTRIFEHCSAYHSQSFWKTKGN